RDHRSAHRLRHDQGRGQDGCHRRGARAGQDRREIRGLVGMTVSALVLVSSTRAAAGEYTDRSGALLVEWLRGRGVDVPDARVVADADLPGALAEVLQEGTRPDVVLISGGTGLTPDDRTPELLTPYLDRELAGIVHAFWTKGMESVPTAVLSRAVAGTVGTTFVMALPGSTGAARDAVAVIDPLLDHLVSMLKGHHDH